MVIVTTYVRIIVIVTTYVRIIVNSYNICLYKLSFPKNADREPNPKN